MVVTSATRTKDNPTSMDVRGTHEEAMDTSLGSKRAAQEDRASSPTSCMQAMASMEPSLSETSADSHCVARECRRGLLVNVPVECVQEGCSMVSTSASTMVTMPFGGAMDYCSAFSSSFFFLTFLEFLRSCFAVAPKLLMVRTAELLLLLLLLLRLHRGGRGAADEIGV